MRYTVTVEGRSYEVDLSGPVPTVDGTPMTAELLDVPGTPVRHLLADGRSVEVLVHRREPGGLWDLEVDGRRFEATVQDERARALGAISRSGATAHGPKPVRAPMPGLVVRVLVAAGDRVEAGQGVVAIEAMKMHNELKADAAGVVARIAVVAGQAVEKGAVLVEFE